MERSMVKSYMYCILDGIAGCHAKNIIHRDIKTANILIDSQGTPITI